MPTSLHVLIIEDSANDAELLEHELQRANLEVTARRVETEADMLDALRGSAWDVILGDYSLPQFNGLAALKLVKKQNLDIPFIFVSGTVGEETAVEAMKEGAADYLFKDRLARLSSAVAHAIETKRLRNESQAAKGQLGLLQSALESAANSVVITNTRGELEWANPAFIKMTGYTLEEVTGQNMRFLKSGRHDVAFYRDLWQTIIAGKVWRGELINRRKDGTLYQEEITITPVRSPEGAITNFIAIKQDVTERQHTENALRESEERLRLALDAARMGTFDWDVPHNRITWSRWHEELWGFKPGEFGGTYEAFAERLHPDDLPSANAEVARCIATHEAFAREFRVVWPDASVHWIYASGEFGFNAAGKPLRMRGVVFEITERKLAETAKETQAIRYKTLLELSSDSIHILNLQGDLLEANAAFYRGLGYTAEEMKCMNVADWDARWTREEIKERLRSLVDQSANFETLHRRKDGTVFDVEASVTSIRIDGQSVLFCATRDITERKRAENVLRESEERYRKLVEFSPDAIYVHCEGKFALLNHVACRLFGATSPADLIGTSILDRIHPEFHPAVKVRMRRIREEQVNIPPLEEKLIRLNGTEFVAEVAAAPFVFQGKPSALVIIRDVTEKKALEEKLLRNQRLESLGTLAGGIAHDLNNVLAPIMMSLDILGLKFADDDSKGLLATISSSVQRGAELVKQVLTFSRGMQGERVAVQLRHIVREMKGIIRETFPKSIALQVQMPSDLWTVKGDATQLHQVLMNLCVNARDAMPKGGKLVIRGENLEVDDAFVAMNPEAKSGLYVLLTVTDSGTGMPPEVQRRIFEPFYTTKELGRGTGLGLSTVLGIVKSHGGFVTVESEVGRGTQFKVYLPAERSTELKNAQPERPASPLGRGELILMVDDEVPIHQIAKERLQKSGYRVVTASNGAEAVAVCAQNARDLRLLITDMMMPVMDGPATIHAVRSLVPNVKVIAASGLGSGTKEIDLSKLSVDAFLRKPFTAEMLLRTISEVLNG